jgi:bifunctional DNA-binding transcriptional regulator/antitoxin component of YhaV-PrlF toxin-antitoxin module
MTEPVKVYQGEVVEDNGELMLQFPPEMIEELGWSPGDTIVWDVSDDDAKIVVRKARPDELNS